jgi:hypothetical protein
MSVAVASIMPGDYAIYVFRQAQRLCFTHFLLTWNCRHIHNAMISRRLSGVCAALGFTLPVLCTPRELMIK